MTDPLNPYAQCYTNLEGPGDARPTARRIIEDEQLHGKWTDRVVLITGATSGIGVETARALYATGANVCITARDLKKAEGVIVDIKNSIQGSGKLEAIEMDMDSLESVKKAAKEFLSKSSKLNVLINNAGIMGLPDRQETEDGFERQFGVCHLAHYALTALLLPTLISSSSASFNSRVIAVASSGHRYSPPHLADVNLTNDYEAWIAYGQAKTANIWLANYIDRTYGAKGVHALAVHPGGIFTPLYVHVNSNPPDMPADWQTNPAAQAFMQSVAQGASTSTWAATAKVLEGVGGKYLCSTGVSGPAKDVMNIMDPGYAPHAFDKEGEDKLWELSSQLTGISVEL